MPDTFYTKLGARVEGPFSKDELAERAIQNKFGTIHEVSMDKVEWEPATELLADVMGTKTSRRTRRRKTMPVAVPPETVSIANENLSETASETSPSSKSNEPPAPKIPTRLWHYSIDGHQAAQAVSESALKAMHRDGLIADSDLVWTDSLPEWVPFSRCPVFNATEERPQSQLSVLSLVCGGIGYLMLLATTAMLVLKLRAGPLVPGDNILLLCMMGLGLAIGIATIVTGHKAINWFYESPGTIKERNLIVLGLSCGYTIVIVLVILGIVTIISANSAEPETTAGSNHTNSVAGINTRVPT